MGFLDTLGPGQKQLLLIGVPVVGAAALWSIHKKSSASSGTVNPTAMPSTQVIGAGQLAEFEQGLTDSYNHLADTVEQLKLDAPTTTIVQQPATPQSQDQPVPIAPVPPLPPVDRGPTPPPAAAYTPPPITNPGPIYNQQPADNTPAPGEPAQWAQNTPAGWYTDIPKPLWW